MCTCMYTHVLSICVTVYIMLFLKIYTMWLRERLERRLGRDPYKYTIREKTYKEIPGAEKEKWERGIQLGEAKIQKKENWLADMNIRVGENMETLGKYVLWYVCSSHFRLPWNSDTFTWQFTTTLSVLGLSFFPLTLLFSGRILQVLWHVKIRRIHLSFHYLWRTYIYHVPKLWTKAVNENSCFIQLIL